MARAILIAAVVAVPLSAHALPENTMPEQMIGFQGRIGGGALAGEGAGDVDQPPLTHGSLSMQVRLLPDWYLELSTYGERTLKAEAPEGKTILGLEGTTLGVRRRARFDKLASNLIVGAGAGSGRVFVQGKGVPGKGESYGGGAVYVLAGLEKEVGADEFQNAGYVGVEAVLQQYLVDEDAPFRGFGGTVRLTFSIYIGGSYCSECF